MNDYLNVGVDFAKALARRDYTAAYAMTSSEYQRGMTLAAMQAAFEDIVPTSWSTVGPVEGGLTMDTWPDKQPADVGWAYVSIGGDVYSEAVVVVVAVEAGALRIRTVEFGRP